MLHRILLLILLSLTAIGIFSQESGSNIAHYKALYPDNDILINQMNRNVEFVFNKDSRTLEAEEEIVYRFTTLKPSVKLELPVFFDDNTEIISTKVSKGKLIKTTGNYHPEGIFHSDLKLCLLELYLAEAGESRTITVKKRHLDIIHYSVIPLGFNLYPVEKSVVDIKYPKVFKVDFIPENVDHFQFGKSEKNWEDENMVSFSCAQIPYFKEEKDMPPQNYYLPQIYVVPRAFSGKTEQIQFFSDLLNYYKWCKNKTDQTRNDPEKIKAIVAQITEHQKTDIEKIKAIYYWVQEHIRYIAFEEGMSGYIPENAQTVLYNKYGDCKGMANLLKTMLIIAGFDARLVWIGTNDIKINFSIPNLANSNHMICALLYQSKIYYLDATNKYGCLGVNSEHIEGRQVLIENNDGYLLDSIPRCHDSHNIISTQTHLKVQNQELTGDITINFTGDLRSSMLDKILFGSDERNKTLEKIISRGSSRISGKNITYNSLSNTDSVFTLNAAITIRGQLSPMGSELILQPDPFEDLSDLSASEDKKLDLYFNIRQQRKYTSTIEIPPTCTITSIPLNFELKNENLSFKLTYSKNGNIFTFTKEWQLLNNTVPHDRIPKWNADLKKIKNALQQPIILQLK